MEEETKTITLKEYNSLIRDRDWLAALEAAGVDNWDGIDHARDLLDS